MLKLKTPNISEQQFRREFSDDVAYLADEGKAYISITCRAGGYLNTKLQALQDNIELHRSVKTYEMVDYMKDRAKYAEMSNELAEEVGRMRFEAFYDACVVSWETNIQNDGKPMTCDKDHFIALAGVKIKEVSDYFVSFARYVDDLSNFIMKADEETEKN